MPIYNLITSKLRTFSIRSARFILLMQIKICTPTRLTYKLRIFQFGVQDLSCLCKLKFALLRA